jgi:hypothetical protein
MKGSKLDCASACMLPSGFPRNNVMGTMHALSIQFSNNLQQSKHTSLLHRIHGDQIEGGN